MESSQEEKQNGGENYNLFQKMISYVSLQESFKSLLMWLGFASSSSSSSPTTPKDYPNGADDNKNVTEETSVVNMEIRPRGKPPKAGLGSGNIGQIHKT